MFTDLVKGRVGIVFLTSHSTVIEERVVSLAAILFLNLFVFLLSLLHGFTTQLVVHIFFSSRFSFQKTSLIALLLKLVSHSLIPGIGIVIKTSLGLVPHDILVRFLAV